LHWQAALDTRLSLIDLPHEYEGILWRGNHRGDTPARLAAAMNRAKFFDNVTWDEIKSNGATDIFETAIMHGSSAIVEYCFANLSNSNDVNSEINSAFKSAASTGQNDVIQRLWALYQAGRITFNLHWLDHGLIYAATFGHINTINLLLDIVPSDHFEDWNAHVDPTAHPLAHALNCKTLIFLLELHQQKKLFCRPGVMFHATSTFITHDRVDLLQILFKMITPSEATWILTHRLMCQETSPVVNCSSETLSCLINLGLKIDPNSELGNSLITLAALNGNIPMIKLLASIDFPVTDNLCVTAKGEGHDEAAEYLSQLVAVQNGHNIRCALC
jgi:ankyrin repeat protein